jgi:hypothetical protein
LEKSPYSLPADQLADSLAKIPALPEPKGIGMAVAFDWGLAVQLLVTPFLAQNISMFNMLKWEQVAIMLLIALPFAALLAGFGEGIRRGWRWTRPIQVVANALGFVGGFVVLYNSWNSIRSGDYWSFVTLVILLIFSPLIAWRLSRPSTAQWFARVTSAEARRRHGGLWPWFIVLWSILGGVLQALAALAR